MKLIWNIDNTQSESLQGVLEKALQQQDTKEVAKGAYKVIVDSKAKSVLEYINNQNISYEHKVKLLEDYKSTLIA